LDLETYIRQLVEKGTVPGFSILTGRDDVIESDHCYGWKSLLPQKETLRENTLYDVASLTKPLVTTLLFLYLMERKEIALDTPVSSLFPQLKEYRGVHPAHLLTHTSGLPGWYPLYLFGKDYLSRFPHIPLSARPGRWVTYSCLGFILLYYIIEKVSGAPFQQLAREIIFEPLDLERTFLSVPENLKSQAAPTEKGNAYEQKMAEHWAKTTSFPWREEIIQGDPHDLNSHYLGGTAGNAGLFSTTRDLFRLCLEFYPATATLLKPGSIEHCWTNYTPFRPAHRTAGFKRNSSLLTSGGRALSRKAIGHNGFTGASIWLDRHHKSKRNTTAIILSNMVHPEIINTNFNRFHRKLHRLML
jgi:CubicO group peptidase (beta-lactamase class C family)